MATTTRRLFALLMCVFAPALAQAQAYPAKSVTVILPFAAGGGMDIFLRPLTQRLSETWGRPVIVDYKPGASGIIGAEYVARSTPDGHTLLASSSSLTINPSLYKMPYEPRELVAVSGLIRDPFGLAVTPGLPVSNVKDLVALARSKPGQLSYATFGIGSPVHLVMEMLQSAAGIKLNHIPYKGSGPATVDVSAGRVDMIINNSSTLAQHSKAGKVRMIAVSSSTRSAHYPDVPTIAESGGLPGFEATGWWGIHAPAAVPRSIVDKVNADVRKMLGDSAFRAKMMDAQGYEPILMTADQFEEFLKRESSRWATIIREAKIKVEQ